MKININNYEIEKTLEKLFNQGYEELYVVRNYITSNAGSTDLWNIYEKIEDAVRWVKLVYDNYEKKYKNFKAVVSFEKFENDFILADILDDSHGVTCGFTYKDFFGCEINQLFVANKVVKRYS